MRRYPVPMTAWQIGRIVGRNPASVSSELCKLARAGSVLAFIGHRREILYGPIDLPAAVQGHYGWHNEVRPYRAGDMSHYT